MFYYQSLPPKWYKQKRQPTGHQAQARGTRPQNGTYYVLSKTEMKISSIGGSTPQQYKTLSFLAISCEKIDM